MQNLITTMYMVALYSVVVFLGIAFVLAGLMLFLPERN